MCFPLAETCPRESLNCISASEESWLFCSSRAEAAEIDIPSPRKTLEQIRHPQVVQSWSWSLLSAVWQSQLQNHNRVLTCVKGLPNQGTQGCQPSQGIGGPILHTLGTTNEGVPAWGGWMGSFSLPELSSLKAKGHWPQSRGTKSYHLCHGHKFGHGPLFAWTLCCHSFFMEAQWWHLFTSLDYWPLFYPSPQ